MEAHQPVARFVVELRNERTPLLSIDLAPLRPRDVEELLGDTLSRREAVGALASVIHQKTAGNPFFVWQFIRALQKAGLVYFDIDRGGWAWDTARIERVNVTDNVVDLLSRAIDDLSRAARDVLSAAACAGKLVDLRALSVALSTTPEDVRELLDEAAAEGFVIADAPRGAPVYRFAHDRVQQAAYARIDEGARQRIHRRLGRYLLQSSTDGDARVFDAADQMNLGASVLASDDERYEVAELDLRAASKARKTAAFGPALAYFVAGIEVLPKACWEARHELAFSLHRDGAECALLSGDHALMSRFADAAIEHARLRRERADIHNIVFFGAIVRSAWDDALALGRAALCDLGFTEDPPSNLEDGLAMECSAIELLMRGRSPEDLVDEPVVEDEDAAATLRLLVNRLHAAWFQDRTLYEFLAARAVRFVLEHGHGSSSSTAFSDWANCLAARGRRRSLASRSAWRADSAIARRWRTPPSCWRPSSSHGGIRTAPSCPSYGKSSAWLSRAATRPWRRTY